MIGYSRDPQQKVAWYEQIDPETWANHEITRLTLSGPRSFAESMDVSDLDGDGGYDIIAKGWLHGQAFLYENTCDPAGGG